MDGSDPVIKYANRIQNLIYELTAADHDIRKLEKKRALLRGLREIFFGNCAGGPHDWKGLQRISVQPHCVR